MSLRFVTDQPTWDAWMTAQPRAQFTQSWAWGVFRESRGQAVVRVMGDRAAALFVKVPAPLVGGYWYAPRGPVAVNADAAHAFLEALVAEQVLPGRALFWRVEPCVEQVSMPRSFVRSRAYMPASTLLVDVTQPEDVLQQAMHEKTRYNIRVAERKGVTVRTATDADALAIFLQLTEETAARDGFRSQPLAYIRATFDALVPFGMARIRLAEQAGNVLAASFEVLYGDTVTYLYGASSSLHRNVMAPYALHWSALQDARQAGYRWYDFYGVNPFNTSSPFYQASWEGITRFKRGWGGLQTDYVGTWELPRSAALYSLLRLFRSFSS